MLERARELNPGLANVEWLRGDGSSLAGIEDASASACVSHVVFQHIPDPRVTLAYVREMGRVLRPGGWAAFQVSNDPAVHTRPGPLRRARRALAGLVRRAPRGQSRSRLARLARGARRPRGRSGRWWHNARAHRRDRNAVLPRTGPAR